MTQVLHNTLELVLQDASLWDEGVEAARNACVAGAPLAAAAITAAAWYDNPLTGGRALLALMQRLRDAPFARDVWLERLTPATSSEAGALFTPGFGYVTESGARTLRSALYRLHGLTNGSCMGFFLEHARVLCACAGSLNATGLCALAFLDAQLDDDEAERRYLLLRLMPALHAAQRARRAGLARFPFFQDSYAYEGNWPSVAARDSELELDALKRAVGIVE